jgi:hypothetical protein
MTRHVASGSFVFTAFFAIFSIGSLAQSIPEPIVPVVEPDNAATYATLLKRVQQGDLSVNFREFRLAGALKDGNDALFNDAAAARQNFNRLFEAGSTQEALDVANQILDGNYASLGGHLDAMLALRKLNRLPEAPCDRTSSSCRSIRGASL